jgi:hypothetical protein
MSEILLKVTREDNGSVSVMYNGSSESAVELSATVAATMNNNVSFKAMIYTALSIAGDEEMMNNLVTNVTRGK